MFEGEILKKFADDVLLCGVEFLIKNMLARGSKGMLFRFEYDDKPYKLVIEEDESEGGEDATDKP